jgi:glycine/D-amino acid oxidase-like deaminating enzyme
MNLKSGYPFWLIKNGLPFTYPKLNANINSDVVILGGGISGALQAYYLIENDIECTLIDARTIGLGSTCASTSLLQYEIDTPLGELQNKVGLKNAVRAYQLCANAIEKLSKIATKIGFGDFVFRESLYYAAYKKDVSFLKDEFKIRKENGFEVSFLDEEQVKKKFGIKSPAAILSKLGAATNAYDFTHHLLNYCVKKGLKIYDRTVIQKIEHQQKKVTLFTDDGYKILTKKLIYATGYESVKYIDEKIVDLQCTFACVSEQANNKKEFWKNETLLWNTADPYLYMRTTKDGRILIGGRDEEFYNPTQRDKLLPKKIKQLVKDFNKLFPKIEFIPEFSWCGTFGATKDGLPYIGNYKKLPNSYFALGFGGNGITFSLIAAEIIKDLILNKNNSDAKIFNFER